MKTKHTTEEIYRAYSPIIAALKPFVIKLHAQYDTVKRKIKIFNTYDLFPFSVFYGKNSNTFRLYPVILDQYYT